MSCTRTWRPIEICERKRIALCTKDLQWPNFLAVAALDHLDRHRLRRVQPSVPPLHQGDQGRHQIFAHRAQAVAHSASLGFERRLDKNPRINQLCQATGQDIAGDPEMCREVVESSSAKQDLSNEQQRPTITQQTERTGDRTHRFFESWT